MDNGNFDDLMSRFGCAGFASEFCTLFSVQYSRYL